MEKLRPDRLIKSAVTRMIWHWETKRSYPVREEVFKFPVRRTSASSFAVRLAVLTTPARINNAAWTAWSILANVKSDLALMFVIDGEAAPALVAKLKGVFPQAEVVTTQAMLDSIAQSCPSVVALAEYHPMGKKMATLLHLQSQGGVLYSDDDVLAFKPLVEIDENIQSGCSVAAYLHTPEHGTALEPSVHMAATLLNLQWLNGINVGFMLLPKCSLSLHLCEQILAAAPRIETWFPDTMLVAILLQQSESRPLPEHQYVTNVDRQFWGEKDVDYNSISLRHFVTPVRFLMYSRGMPLVKARTTMDA